MQYLNSRKTVSAVCLGADLYLCVTLFSGVCFMLSAWIAAGFFPGLSGQADMLDGLMMLATVVFGCILLMVYAFLCASRGTLFPGEDPVREMLAPNRRIRPFTFAALLGMIFAAQIVCGLQLELLEFVLNRFGLTVTNSPAMNADYTMSPSLLLYAVLIGPAAEELVFRGFVLKGLKPCGRVFAIVVSALLFSLMHGDIQQLLFTFLAGLVMGYAAMEFSILVSFAVHVFNNGVLSELMLVLSGELSENVFATVNLGLFLLSLTVTIVWLVKKRRSIAGYLSVHRTVPGAVTGLFNPWFIAFAALGILETAFTVTPL